jgi:hypothetical protein
MDRYVTDRPNIRFDWELKDVRICDLSADILNYHINDLIYQLIPTIYSIFFFVSACYFDVMLLLPCTTYVELVLRIPFPVY